MPKMPIIKFCRGRSIVKKTFKKIQSEAAATNIQLFVYNRQFRLVRIRRRPI